MGIYHSEKSLENFLNAGSLPSPLIINAKGGVFNVNGAPGEFFVSDEAKAMLLVYTALGVSLFGTERIAMIHYVNSEVTSGNHAKKDYEVIFSLAGVNSLIDYVGSKVATAINAPSFDVNGVTTDGITQSVNSNFNPSTDGANYLLNDSNITVYIKTDNGNSKIIIGNTSAAVGKVQLFYFDDTHFLNIINGGATTQIVTPSRSGKKLVSFNRISNTQQETFVAGVTIGTENKNSDGIQNQSLFIAKRDIVGSLFFDGTISLVSFGGNPNNELDKKNNIDTLLTSLGALP